MVVWVRLVAVGKIPSGQGFPSLRASCPPSLSRGVMPGFVRALLCRQPGIVGQATLLRGSVLNEPGGAEECRAKGLYLASSSSECKAFLVGQGT